MAIDAESSNLGIPLAPRYDSLDEFRQQRLRRLVEDMAEHAGALVAMLQANELGVAAKSRGDVFINLLSNLGVEREQIEMKVFPADGFTDDEVTIDAYDPRHMRGTGAHVLQGTNGFVHDGNGHATPVENLTHNS